jgi:hypothetical protein
MPTVPINKFDGNKAEDIRTFATNESQDSYNFDLYTNPHKLLPIRDSVDETTSAGTMAAIQISDVGTSVISSNVYLTAVGYASSISTAPAFYTRSSGMNGSWGQQAAGTGTYQQGSMVVYKQAAYCVASASATTFTLQKYVGAGSVTTAGTTTVDAVVGNGYPVPRPFVHPEDNVLYFCISNVISKWDGTTYTNYANILPTGYDVTSLTDYGTYLAIAMRPRNGVGKSICYLWGRDGTINTLQGIIDFGEGDLNIIENIGNELVGIVYPQSYSTFSSVIDNKINIKVYAGGAIQTVKSFTLAAALNYGIAKHKNGNKLYFGACESLAEVSLWCVYRNKEGSWVAGRERYLYTGSTSVSDVATSVVSITSVGDFFYIGFFLGSGPFTLRATSSTAAFTNTSVFKTTINPNMPLADRYAQKQLQAVAISYTGASSGLTGLKYSVDGSAFTSLISSTNATGEYTVEATNENDGTVFLSGREFQFQAESSGGSQIKEIGYKYSRMLSTI